MVAFQGRLRLLPIANYNKILDPPTTVLANGSETSMAILKYDNKVLLELPNTLGWRYHFGVAGDDLKLELQDALGKTKFTDPEPAGLIYFSFPNHISPMRVKVYVMNLTSDPQGGGTLYDYDDVPYDNMWADDRIWMPTLLLEGSYFEAHFHFDGPPGKETKIDAYEYQTYG